MSSKTEKTKKIGGLKGAFLRYLFIAFLGFGGFFCVKTYLPGENDGFLHVFATLVLGIVLLAILSGIRKKYRRDNVSAFDDGWIQYLISEKLITIVIPVIVMAIVFLVKGNKSGESLVGFGGALLVFFGIFFGAYVYDKAVRNFFDFAYLKYRNGSFAAAWLSVLTSVLSAGVIVAAIYFLAGSLPSVSVAVFILLTEIYVQCAYVRGGMVYDRVFSRAMSFRNRAFLSLLVFGPVLCNAGLEISAYEVPQFLLYMCAAVSGIYLLVLFTKHESVNNKCYEAVESWGVDASELYSYTDYIKSKKKIDASKTRMGEDTRITRYAVISIILCGVIFAAHYGLHYIVPDYSCSVDFIRDNGAELLSTMISSIFLIVSFLSFLGDKDDKILWTDMRTFRLVNPQVMNFIGLTVFSFASLIGTAVALVAHYDILFIVFFVLGLFFQAYLTFLVIISYFRREETIYKLKTYAIATLGDPEREEDWEDIWDGIYENSCILAEDKNWSKLQENFDFLVSLYDCVRNSIIKSRYRKEAGYGNLVFSDSAEQYALLLRKAKAEDESYSLHILERLEACVGEILQLVKDDKNVSGRLIRRNKQSLYIPVVLKMAPDSLKKLEYLGEMQNTDMEKLEDASHAKAGIAKKRIGLSLSIGSVTIDLSGRKEKAAGGEASSLAKTEGEIYAITLLKRYCEQFYMISAGKEK